MKRRARTRREFMRLLAAGSAAAMAAPVAAMAAEKAAPAPAAERAPRQRRARTGEPDVRPALPEELEKQRKYLAESLERIRKYPLPPGAAPAFEFRPLRQKAARRTAR